MVEIPWVRPTRVWDPSAAHYDAVGGFWRGLDIEDTLLEEVCGFGGALAVAFGVRPSTRMDGGVAPAVTRHDL